MRVYDLMFNLGGGLVTCAALQTHLRNVHGIKSTSMRPYVEHVV